MVSIGLKTFKTLAMRLENDISASVSRGLGSAATKPIRLDTVVDTFQKSKATNPVNSLKKGEGTKYTFDDLFYVIGLGQDRIRLLPKIFEVNGQKLSAVEMPKYLYHITSKSSWNKILESKTLKRSLDEQLPGIYFLDKTNFLQRYPSVEGMKGQKRDLLSSLIRHASRSNDGVSDLVVIRVPTSSLLKSGNMRFRTQEDFFYFQDMVLDMQKGVKNKFTLRMLSDDKNRAQFEHYILSNGIMSKSELEKFMLNMKNAIHQGHKIFELPKYDGKYAIEYIFNKDITKELVPDLKVKTFNVDDIKDSASGGFDKQKLQKRLQNVFM